MTTTNNLVITHISASQAQKEVTMNAAIDRIDAILNRGAIDRALDTPPGSPASGDLYILGAAPTGAWTGRANDVAYYLNSTWYFIDAKEGFTLWVNDEDMLYTWTGAAWSVASGIIQNASLIGVNATADATNKLSVASSGILFSYATANCQVKVNKAAIGDTASVLYQTATSGRAEIGLVASDDFVFKTSPDGSAFTTAITLDKTTAAVTIGKFLGFTAPTELTIASGVVTATQCRHTIDTQSDDASDDLDTISGGAAEQILIINASNDARTVVVKHGTGNIYLNGAADFSLDNTKDRLVLLKSGSDWVQIGGANNAA